MLDLRRRGRGRPRPSGHADAAHEKTQNALFSSAAAGAHRCILRRRRQPPAACAAANTVCCPLPQVVREHYLRDDIYSGSPLDPDCPPDAYKLSSEAPHYLIVDTNVALHQVCLVAACLDICSGLLGRCLFGHLLRPAALPYRHRQQLPQLMPVGAAQCGCCHGRCCTLPPWCCHA